MRAWQGKRLLPGTVDDVVRHYNRGGGQGSPIIRPLNLTEAEIADLVAFLESLIGEGRVEEPEVPQGGGPWVVPTFVNQSE